MIDPKKEMIIINHEDKTLSIEHYEYSKPISKYQITFNGSDKIYNYNVENIIILTNPQSYDTSNKQIFYSGKLITENKKILHFSNTTHSYFRFFKNNGDSYSIPEKALSIRDIKKVSISLEKWLESQEEATSKEIMNWLNAIDADLSDAAQQNLVYFFKLAKGIQQIELLEKEKQQKSYEEIPNKACFITQCYENLDFIHEKSMLKTYLEKRAITQKQPTSTQNIFPFYFNLSQKAALENALNNSISIIEGPPGTGKTQTILNILVHLTMEGKSTGIVSFNNKAVENIKEKLEKNGYGFLVAELGNNEKRKNFFENQPKFNIDAWEKEDDSVQQHKRLKKLTTDLEKLLHDKNKLSLLELELSNYKLEQIYFEKFFLSQKIKETIKIPFAIKTSDYLIEYLTDTELERRLNSFSKFFQKIKILFKYNVSHFGKKKKETVETILCLQKKFYELKISELQSNYDHITQKLHDVSFTSLQEEHQKISEGIFKKSLYNSHGNQKFKEFASDEFKEKFNIFSKQYPVIISTAHSIRRYFKGIFLIILL